MNTRKKFELSAQNFRMISYTFRMLSQQFRTSFIFTEGYYAFLINQSEIWNTLLNPDIYAFCGNSRCADSPYADSYYTNSSYVDSHYTDPYYMPIAIKQILIIPITLRQLVVLMPLITLTKVITLLVPIMLLVVIAILPIQFVQLEGTICYTLH